MAMFQQYQGGIAPVQGMAEAGANIGRFAQQGMQEFGKSLAEGIQTYHQNMALDQQATEEGHAVAQQLAFYHQIAGMSPENSALLPALDEQVQKLQKLPTMSLSQKLGALNGAKSVISQFGQNYQLNQLMQQQRATNALGDAEKDISGENVKVMSAIIKDTPYDPTLSPQQNIDTKLIPKVREGVSKGVKALPDDEIISRYLAGAREMVATATDKNGNPLDPRIVSGLADQLSKYAEYGKGQETGFADESGVTDYAKEAEGYKAAVSGLPEYLSPEKPLPSDAFKISPENLDVIKARNELKDAYLTKNLLSAIDNMSANEAADYILKNDNDKGEWSKYNEAWRNLSKAKKSEDKNKISNALDDIKKVLISSWDNIDENVKEAEEKHNSILKRERLGQYAGLPKDNNERVGTYEKEISTLDEQIKEVQNNIDKGEAISPRASEKFKSTLREWSYGLNDWMAKHAATDIARYSDKKITAEEADKLIMEASTKWSGVFKGIAASAGSKLNALPWFMAPLNAAIVSVFPDIAGRELTINEVNNLKNAAERFDATRKQAWSSIENDPSRLIEALKQKKQVLSQQAQEIKDKQAKEEKAKNPSVETKDISPISTGNVVAGSYESRTPLTLDQKKEQARQWFMENKQYGYIPSSFNQIWEQQHPEAKLQFVTAPNGVQFYSDGKGEWKPMPAQKEAMSPEEQAKYAGRMYNNQEVLAGTGIIANGIITGEKPNEVKKNLTSAADAIVQIDRLVNITKNNFGKSLDFTTRAEAQKYVNFLKSAIRPELFPSGRVAEWEQIILDKLVPDPTGIWTLDTSTLKSLEVLREQIMNNIAANAANHGITVSYNTASRNHVSSLATQVRQANAINRPKQ